MNLSIFQFRLTARLLVALLPIWTTGCHDNGNGNQTTEQETPDVYSYELLKEYTSADIRRIERDFLRQYTPFSSEIKATTENDDSAEGDVKMRVYKVKVTTKHPDGSGKPINLSGVLIAPPAENGRVCRRVVALPYTYVMKDEAPTLRVANDRLDAHLTFWIKEAYDRDDVVMMPDYPGFGDSYGQCYIPYVERAPMIRTTIAYMESAMAALAAEKYQWKNGYVIAGYSLGAYVSLQLAYELETVDKYATREDTMKVDLLMTGGTPCNLLETANLIRAAETLPQPYLLPLSLLGYKNNGYRHIVMSDYLREPYASGTSEQLDGMHSDYNSFFPQKTSELFTESFIKNENMGEINRILTINSVKSWNNRCRFVMTHGKDDETVYYAQAQHFADMQAQSGNVSFVQTEGTHSSASLWFFLRLFLELN